jgi:hypothetical protein
MSVQPTSQTGTTGATNGPPPEGAAGKRVSEFALVAVVIGVAVLAILDVVVLLLFRGNATNAVTIIGATNGPIAVIVSAYFGIRLGSDSASASKVQAEQDRSQATQQAIALAAQMPPEIAKPALQRLGVPVAE